VLFRSTLAHEPGPAGGELRFALAREPGAAGLPPLEFLAAVCGPLLPEPRLCRVRRTALLGRDAAGRWRAPVDLAGEAHIRLRFRQDVYA